MTDINVSTTYQEDDLSAYRFGQSFSYDRVGDLVDRDGFAYFLTYGLPEQAIGKGFELVDPKTEEPLDNSDEIWEEVEKYYWKKVLKGKGIKNTYGHSYQLLVPSDNPAYEGKPILKVFEPGQVDSTQLEYYIDETIKKIKFDQKTFDGKGKEYIIDSPTKFEDFYDDIRTYKDNYWEGRSYLEPIWDEIISIRLIRMGATIFAIRTGAGLKIITIPPGTHPDVITSMKAAAKKLDSYNGFFLLPIEGASVDIETGGQMIDYASLRNCALEAISTYTGYPIAGFRGIEMERQGGEFNTEMVFDCWRTIQREAEQSVKWLLLRLNDHFSWGLTEENFKLLWKTREEISEEQRATIDNLIAQSDVAYVQARIRSEQEIRDDHKWEGAPPEPLPMPGYNIKVDGLDDKEKDEQNE